MTRPPYRPTLDSISDLSDQIGERTTVVPEFDYEPVREKLVQIIARHPYWGQKLKAVLDKILEAKTLPPNEIMEVLNRQEPLGALVHFENVQLGASQQRPSNPNLQQPEIPPARPSAPSMPPVNPYTHAVKGGSGQLDGLHQRVRTLLGGALADPNKPVAAPSNPPLPGQSTRKPQK